MRIILLILLILNFLQFVYSQDSYIPGIKFNSQNVQKSEKTSLFLNEGNPIQLKNSFSISFDISFWDYKEFGPIFRIQDNNGREFRIVYSPFKDKDTSIIELIDPSNKNSIALKLPKKDLIRNNWFNFKLIFDKSRKKIKAYHNNSFVRSIDYKTINANNYKFVFGIKEINNPNDFDVPAISIKNIKISENNSIKYFWELNPFKENPLLDKFSNSSVKTLNPSWLYQDHQKWKNAADFKISNSSMAHLGVAFDSINHRLFIDRRDDLLIYDLVSGKDSIIKYKSKSPAYWNDLFYDDNRHNLYSYFTGRGKVSVYDLNKNEWIVKDVSTNSNGYYFGSAKFSYPNDDDLFLLGGYGWYKAKNDLFSYDFTKQKWVKVSLKKNEMTPRAWFTFGKGFNNGEYLIYGGIGNESGNQEEGFKSYYDLFLLNMNDTTITKLKLPEQKFDYGMLFNDAYLDKKDSSFYFLSQIEEGNGISISLNKLDLRTGKVIPIGNKFWKRSAYKWMYSYLHYNKATNEFISVIFDSTKVELFSINYPPISETAKVYTQNKNSGTNNYLLILISIIVLMSGASVFVYMKKRNSNAGVSKSDKKEESYNFVTRHIKNSINLFGGLWIYDNSENEISQSLSPKLKEIFLLILLRSINNHRSGITSEELSSIIWPDSSPESVKSNRGVAINKLRKILSSVEGIDLEFSEKLWFIKFNNGSSCDYLEFLKLKTDRQNVNGSVDNSFQTIANIFAGGEFLKGISYGWLDSIKFAINNEVIIFFKQYFDDKEIQQDFDKRIQLCDIILLFDPVDQDAIKSKIKTLSSIGKHHIAKSSYNLFIAEYKRLYDEDFPLSFDELINS